LGASNSWNPHGLYRDCFTQLRKEQRIRIIEKREKEGTGGSCVIGSFIIFTPRQIFGESNQEE